MTHCRFKLVALLDKERNDAYVDHLYEYHKVDARSPEFSAAWTLETFAESVVLSEDLTALPCAACTVYLFSK